MPFVILIAGYVMVIAMIVWFNYRFWQLIHEKENELTTEQTDVNLPSGIDSPI